MAARLPFSALIMTAGSLALLTLSAVIAVSEFGPFSSWGLSERATVRSMANGMLGPGISSQSQIDYLYNCRVALTSLTGRAQPSAVRATMLDHCEVAVQTMIEAAPDFSAAWYTAALIASFRDQPNRLNEALRRSYDTGPFEQWIAQLRVDLVEDTYSGVDEELRPLHQMDLANLLSNDPGRRFLAPRYLAFVDLHDRVDQALTTIDDAHARRFLNIAERLLREKDRSNGR
jgi:hypothetical protein